MNRNKTIEILFGADRVNNGKEGWASLREWQPTWKHHHTPVWFKKRLRQRLIKMNKWTPCFSSYLDRLPGFFDHWGSYEVDGRRVVATQPYGGDQSKAKEFAEEIDCKVYCFPVGAWHPRTKLFIFDQKQ